MGAAVQAQVTELPWTEGFENGQGGWTFVDQDGDGHNWEIFASNWYSHGGSSHYLRSQSYLNDNALTPDNYAFSPAITLLWASLPEFDHECGFTVFDAMGEELYSITDCSTLGESDTIIVFDADCEAEVIAPVAHIDTVWRTLTVNTNVDGAAETYGSGVYADGSTVEIGLHVLDTMTDGGHWEFLGWSDGGNGNPRYIVLVSDSIITALYQWVADTTDTTDTTGIRNVCGMDFVLSPNHATSVVGIGGIEAGMHLSIVDAAGCEVYRCETTSTDQQINVSTLKRGVYFVRLRGEGYTATRKLIVSGDGQ